MARLPSTGRRWYEVPRWVNWVSYFLFGLGVAALAFHPAVRRERDLRIWLLCIGGIFAIGGAGIACKWLIDVRRGNLPKASIFQSKEQVMRDIEQELAHVQTLARDAQQKRGDARAGR